MQIIANNKLPIPEKTAIERSQQLQQEIINTISQHGKLTFADFMQIALYHPQLGYYNSPEPIFGRAGDFITAPELSPLFAYALAKQCQEIFMELGNANIYEFGAGSGILAGELLKQLASLDALPQQYFIFEPSQELVKKQQSYLSQSIPEYYARIVWLAESKPEHNFTGVILANEVLDAMPIHRFWLNEHEQAEYYLDYQNNQLTWCLDKVEHSELNHFLTRLRHQLPASSLQNGYSSEINLQINDWVQAINHWFKAGLILLIDYGYPEKEYYHPHRNTGTLACYYRHLYHTDPLFYPGLQDITAHVDFSALMNAALQCNLDVIGYCSQASFLLSCGITDLIANNIEQNFALAQQIKMLTMPHEMGELFKVMGISRNLESSLLGFTLQNKLESL